jgi:hypothetical protein
MDGQQLVLERGSLRVEITPRPFAFTVRRGGRRLLRDAGAWVAQGTVRDQFIHLTEGLIANEEPSPLEPARYAEIVSASGSGAELALTLHGGRGARLGTELAADERIELRLEADGDPLRLAVEWDRRSDERLVGLGARHGTDFDQGGRRIQLGSDRRYTGPDCPPEMLSDGGVPQGDCAPMPWCNSSRGYGAWIQTDANGTQFDLSGSRIAVSTRAARDRCG